MSELNPFIGIQNAVTRTPQELPTVEAAVRAYTINAAYVMRQEDKTGSLEVGKLADLIIIDRDIFSVEKNQIRNTNVLLTMLGGKEVYVAPDFSLSTSDNTFDKTDFSLQLYPNRVADQTTLKLKGAISEDLQIKIIDASGRVVQQIKNVIGQSAYVLNVSKLAEGMYFVKVIENGLKELGTKSLVVVR